MSNKIVKPSGVESRALSGLELRATKSGDKYILSGYAATYGVPSADLGGFREVIAPGAFSDSLKSGADVKATLNHDPNMLLGRVKNGTLKLEDDERGLAFTCQLNADSQLHRDIFLSVKRGDISECSFAFTVVAPNGDKWESGAAKSDTGTPLALRTLLKVSLIDVSTVTYPAYPGATKVDARSAAHYVLAGGDWRQAMRAKLSTMHGDWARESKAHEIRLQVIADQKR